MIKRREPQSSRQEAEVPGLPGVRLALQRTPDKPPKRRTVCKVGGALPGLERVGLCAFLAGLFQLNEKLETKRKMTDAEIIRQLSLAYPDSRVAQSLTAGRRTLQHFRSLYNHGQLVWGIPEPQSVRYMENGLPYTAPKNKRKQTGNGKLNHR